ncbi:MAG: DUF4157 domain-containing protein, partial [Acidobacteriota bacterium]
MSAPLQSQVKAASVKPSLTSAQTGMLQRKCECGGVAGMDGQCEKCKKGDLNLQRFSVDRVTALILPRSLNNLGYNFGEIKVFAHRPNTVQTKSNISGTEDEYEKEADRIAKQIVKTSTPLISQTDQHSLTLSASQPLIQRQVADRAATGAETEPPLPTSAATASEETSANGLIVEDEVERVGSGQMKKSDFLDQLQAAICTVADAELAGVGRNTQGCPYIEKWIGYYRTRSSNQVERALRKYVSGAVGARSASDYIPIVVERVRSAISIWAVTGQVTGVPEGASLSPPETTSVAEQGDSTSVSRRVQLKSNDSSMKGAMAPMAIQSRLHSGNSLDNGVRSRMESAFGYNFSQVRVHTDSQASNLSANLNARAFTIGNNIAFAAGEYKPGTMVGDALLAHELAHVVQQNGASSNPNSIQETGTEQNA